MNDDLFATLKRDSACLNDYRISLVACGDASLDDAARSHVDTCAFCQGRLKAEAEQLRAQVYEPLPPVFMPKPRAGRAWRQVAGFLASGAVCAAAAWAVLVAPGPRATVRLKGGEASLSATVQRHGETVLDDEPLESMHTLREGDRLRLRLAGDKPAWVVVQGLEEGAWTTYFKGAPPADGWLPFGLELTKDGQTRLRLLSCEKPLDETRQDVNTICSERLFTL